MAYRFNKADELEQVDEKALNAIADDGSYVIVLDHGTSADGRAYWLYIAAKTNKYTEFRQMVVQRKIVHYKEYGTILRHGYERQVPEYIKQEMKDLYGIGDDYMAWLIKDFEKARQTNIKEKEVEDDKRIGEIVAMLKKKE